MDVSTRPATYRNPFWPRGFADPFVLKVRGQYYAYATEAAEEPASGSRVFPILHSEDLTTWREAGRAMPALGPGYFWYWAPEVTAYNGQFLLYYAVHTAQFAAAIRVAVADRPEGPFTDSGHDLTTASFPWAIDPHVFRDRDGQWYLYMTVEYLHEESRMVGSGNAVDRLLDPFTTEGSPARVTGPTQPWQLFEAQRAAKGGVDWYCVEGPAVMRHRGRYVEMYSGGCYYRDSYAISYATSPVPRGSGGMLDTSWQDWTPQGRDGRLVRGDARHAVGPGHNSLVLGPNNADLYMAYHAWPPEMTARLPYLDRLFWHGDELWSPAPTDTPQPAPALPRLHEAVDGASAALQPSWRQHGGHWRAGATELIQDDRDAAGAALYHHERLGPCWLLEVNLRRGDGGGRYGVLLRNAHGSDARVLFDPETKQIVATAGAVDVVAEMREPFVATAWHQLLLEYAGSRLRIALDGLPILEAVVAGLTAQFALVTERCSAAFTAISLSDHFRDEFLDGALTVAQLGWHELCADGSTLTREPPAYWRIGGGVLEQSDDAPGERQLYKGPALDSCEFGATMRLLAGAASHDARMGMVVRYSDGGIVLIWLARHGQGSGLLAEGRGSCAGISAAAEAPAGFDPWAWHTVRLVRRGDGLTVCLDGPAILSLALPAGAIRLGLATGDASVAFTGVWQTGLNQ